MKKVLVIGVRGQTGREVAAQLAGRTDGPVRGTARDPSTVDVAGVTPVRFDWQDPATWSGAIDGGVDAVYLVRPEIDDAPERIAAFLAAAPDIGKVVLLSEIDAENRPSPESDWVVRVEEAVKAGAKAWTILRPASFHQMLTDERVFLGAVRDPGDIEMPTGGAAISFVDARDIAAVAVEALLNDDHAGKAYTLTGPEAVTFEDLAARLSAVVGHPVRHVDGPLDETLDAWTEAGVEPFMVDFYRGALGRVRAGGYARSSDDIERVTGRPPRSIDAFIDENADAWRR